VKFGLREIERIFFSLKHAILSFGKCLNNLILGFQGDDIFLHCDKTKLKRSSKIFFFCFRAASLGGSGLTADRINDRVIMNKLHTTL